MKNILQGTLWHAMTRLLCVALVMSVALSVATQAHNSGAQLTCNTDAEVQDDNGNTALIVACQSEYVDVVNALVTHKKKRVNVNAKNKEGKAGLHVKYYHEDNKPIWKLLIEHGFNANTPQDNVKLLDCVAQEQDIEMVELLLSKKLYGEKADLVGLIEKTKNDDIKQLLQAEYDRGLELGSEADS